MEIQYERGHYIWICSEDVIHTEPKEENEKKK
jgi:hypothetical protein